MAGSKIDAAPPLLFQGAGYTPRGIKRCWLGAVRVGATQKNFNELLSSNSECCL